MINYFLKYMNALFQDIKIILWLLLIVFVIFIIIFLRYFVVRVFWIFDNKRINKRFYKNNNLEKFINESIVAQKKYKQPANKVPFMINISNGYVNQGSIIEGLDYIKSINIEKCNKFLKGEYYNYMSYFYCLLNDLDNALQYYKKGEEFINEYSKSPKEYLIPLRTLGYIEMLKGNYPEAEKILLEVKEKLVADSYFKTTIYLNLAKIYVKTKRYSEAKSLLESILKGKIFPRDKSDAEALLNEINTNKDKENI
ncbi:MAG: tetratricopeptide repeat protein [Firmicutes bacterium]|nr:tetratricopeptide repeat protein [Bacillota bacterium]